MRKPLIILLVFLVASGFGPAERVKLSVEANNQTDSLHVDSLATMLYKRIDFSQSDTLDKSVFSMAICGFAKLMEQDKLANDSLLTVIDYSLSSKNRRLWVINLFSGEIEMNEWVAHGKNTGGEYARSFSNSHRSKMSSIGFMVTGVIYDGKHKESLKLIGAEPYFNSNVLSRGVVFHGADYVRAETALAGLAIGRSFGCPAVRQEANSALINLIQGGSCVFAYYPKASYLARSKYVNHHGYVYIEHQKEEDPTAEEPTPEADI